MLPTYACIVMENDKQIANTIYRGENSALHMLEYLVPLSKKLVNNMQKHRFCPTLTADEMKSYEDATICWLCEDNIIDRVRDHCHFTGLYRGPACSKCNLAARNPRNIKINVWCHNSKGYDEHLIFQELPNI